MNCFIDSNIWLYGFIEGQDPAKTEKARVLIAESAPSVSTQVINEVCVNLIKQSVFTEPEARDLVASFYARYPVYTLTQAILLRASRLRQRYALSFWDSMIVSAAREAEVETLYSEDMQHGLVVEERLEIVNPFER